MRGSQCGIACHILYASWQLDFTMEVLPNQGTVYIWKEQSAFYKREMRMVVSHGYSKKGNGQHQISEVQVRDCGCLVELLVPYPSQPQTTLQDSAVASW